MRRQPGVVRTAAMLLGLVFFGMAGGNANADPVFGSAESFPGVSIGEWTSGQAGSISNPGTGGLGGTGDGYLLLTQETSFNFGARGEGARYAGNWTAAGITHVSLWLNDIGAADNFEIHFGIGNPTNRWMYNVGFTPVQGEWTRFIVDLTNAANFTQIIGTDTFANALLTADRIQFRHDLPPFERDPDDTTGDLGVDEIVLGDLATPTHATSWGRVKALYR